MSILDRYLGSVVIRGSLLALAVLVGLAAFFALLAEMGDLRNDYGLVQAIVFVALTLPRQAYELLPTAVLIGGLMGLGALAANSELVVVRAAGVSVARVARSALQAGLVLALLAIVLGEFVAPPAERKAQMLRSTAQSGHIALQSGQGVWVREGNRFVNVGRVLPEARLQDVSVYRLGEDRSVASSAHVEFAQYRDGQWWLRNVRESRIGPERVEVTAKQSAQWSSLFDPGLLDVLAVQPEDLSARALFAYIGYLERNGLDPSRYELAFWNKLLAPVSTLVMLLIAIPFVFGRLRSASAGPRMLVGILVGLGFYLLNQALNHAGLVYGLPPLLSAILPGALVVLLGVAAIRRVG